MDDDNHHYPLMGCRDYLMERFRLRELVAGVRGCCALPGQPDQPTDAPAP